LVRRRSAVQSRSTAQKNEWLAVLPIAIGTSSTAQNEG
jgi:hypothetical protein